MIIYDQGSGEPSVNPYKTIALPEVSILPIQITIDTKRPVDDRTLGHLIEEMDVAAGQADGYALQNVPIQLDRPLALSEISRIASAERRFALDTKNDQRFFIHRIRRGSVIIDGGLLILAAWVAKNLLGDTLKDAWKATETREKLQKLVTKSIDDFSTSMVDRIRAAHWRNRRLDLISVERTVRAELPSDYKIVVVFKPERDGGGPHAAGG